ncbi:MAG: hypothetical protein ACRDYC_14235, partial [Acidimicrobiales bacterium]
MKQDQPPPPPRLPHDPTALHRRLFLTGSAALAGGAALTACGGGSGGASGGLTTEERRLIVVAASVEQMIVNVYASAMGTAASKVGPVPGTLTAFWHAAAANHTAHILAWTNLLGPTSQTNSVAGDHVMTPVFDSRLAGVSHLSDLIALCVD